MANPGHGKDIAMSVKRSSIAQFGVAARLPAAGWFPGLGRRTEA